MTQSSFALCLRLGNTAKSHKVRWKKRETRWSHLSVSSITKLRFSVSKTLAALCSGFWLQTEKRRTFPGKNSRVWSQTAACRSLLPRKCFATNFKIETCRSLHPWVLGTQRGPVCFPLVSGADCGQTHLQRRVDVVDLESLRDGLCCHGNGKMGFIGFDEESYSRWLWWLLVCKAADAILYFVKIYKSLNLLI